MANIRVKPALEKIDNDLARVVEQIVHYSGIDQKNARFIENAASGICQAAARIVEIAQSTQGMKYPDTEKKVREALGYTYP